MPLTTRFWSVLPLRGEGECMGSSLLPVRKLYLLSLHTFGIWPLLKATLNILFGFSEFIGNRWCFILWTGEVFKDQQCLGDSLQKIPVVVDIWYSICLYCVGIVLQCSIACPFLLLDYKLLGVWIWFLFGPFYLLKSNRYPFSLQIQRTCGS